MDKPEPIEDQPSLTPYPRTTARLRHLRPWGEHPIVIGLPYFSTLVAYLAAHQNLGDDFPDPQKRWHWVAIVLAMAIALSGWCAALAVTLSMADRYKNREKCMAAIVNCFVTWSALFVSAPLWIMALNFSLD